MANTYVKIAEVSVGAGGASSIDFTSIPNTYTDLLVNLSTRSTKSDIFDSLYMQFNGSTTSYSHRGLQGNGASASSYSGSGSNINVGNADGATATSNTFNSTSIYIPNYAGSTNKSVSSDDVLENNATTAYATLLAGLWSNTAAITSIKIFLQTGNFVQYSTAYLYGISKS